MPPRFPVIAVLVGIAVALVAVVLGGAVNHGRPAPAPPLPRETLRGPTVTIASLRGRATLVNFWASWCHPCQQEAPQLAAFASSTAGRERLVGVDTGDNASAARKFIAHYGWSFPVLRDGDETVANSNGLPGLPITFVLDARGRIVARLIGPQTQGSLVNALRSAGG